MAYSLRQMSEESKFCQEIEITAFQRVLPAEQLQSVLSDLGAWEQRERKINMQEILWLVIAMNLYPTLSQPDVLEQISQGTRYVCPQDEIALPTKGAISQRRKQLGVKPLVELFHRTCCPLATEHTPGAMQFGLRVMAVDSTLENVADTPANGKAFGYLHNQRGRSPFPQVRGVYLMECGTHAIIDAGFWPCHVGEITGAKRLLRSVKEGMLLLWDSGFHSAALIGAVRQRKAHLIGRLSSTDVTHYEERLSDGTWRAILYPDDPTHRKGQGLEVRVIEYTINDPKVPGAGEKHRLVTTLLDPDLYPAEKLIAIYHERWEIELAIDEIDTHQRLLQRTLRSQTPAGVMQELYGVIIGHYALRFLMHEAAMQAGVDPDRISFVRTIHVLHRAVSEFQMTAPAELPRLYDRMLRDVARNLLPARRLRFSSRCVKRKCSKFRVKRPTTSYSITLKKSFLEVITLI